MKENEQVYTIERAAEYLQVGERYIRDSISSGELNAYRRGKRAYVLHSDLIEFIRRGKNTRHIHLNKKD